MYKPLALALMTAALGAVASANLVVNGDFELSVPNNGFGNSWTGIGNDGAGGWRSSGGNPNGMFILNAGGSGGSNPGLSQSISGLTVGATYNVSGDYTVGNIGGHGLLDFGVTIDGNTWEYELPNFNWHHFSQDFVATSATVTLLLEGERHGDDDPRVDNISLDFVSDPVPEPATMAVVGLGALALRRRKKA